MSWKDADTGPFNPDNDDRAKIESGAAVPCRLCEAAFRRLRLTMRYCAKCRKGFCEGEHGNFAPRGGGATCVRCGPQPSTDPSQA